MRPALFLDRDGVINVDHGYVSTADRFELVPGIVELLRLAKARDYLLIVVTNQSGIARGLYSEAEYNRLERHMREQLAARGVELDSVYYCPHHPEGSVPEFAVACDCRKPAPGLILAAAADHDVNLPASILVGDKASDLEAARAAGVGRAFLVPDALSARQSRDTFREVAAVLEAGSPTNARV